jgi:hypothetical protein
MVAILNKHMWRRSVGLCGGGRVDHLLSRCWWGIDRRKWMNDLSQLWMDCWRRVGGKRLGWLGVMNGNWKMSRRRKMSWRGYMNDVYGYSW